MWPDLLQRVDHALALQEGWDSYKAAVPTIQAAELTKTFLRLAYAENARPNRVAADTLGGYGVTYYSLRRDRTAYFYFNNLASAWLLLSEESTNYANVVEADDLPTSLNQALRYIGCDL